MKAHVSTALAFAVILCGANCAASQELLRVGDKVVKWASPKTGSPTIITYAVLQAPYNVPREKSTLSPDNCSAMLSFSKVVSASPGVTETAAKQQLREAFDAWSSVANVVFLEEQESRRANIVIGASSVAKGRAFANLSYRGGGIAALAVTKALGGIDRVHLMKREGAVIEQAYICLNPKMRWKIGFDGNLDVYDLRYTFTHEIGHAIGLDHPGTTGAIMAYRYDEHVRSLQDSDVDAARFLYGPPHQLR